MNNCCNISIILNFHSFEADYSLEVAVLYKKTDFGNILLIRVVATSIAIAHIFRLISTEFYHPFSASKKLFLPLKMHFYESDTLYSYYPLFFLTFCVSATTGLINTLSIAVCLGLANIISCELDVLKTAFQNARDSKLLRPIANSKKKITKCF